MCENEFSYCFCDSFKELIKVKDMRKTLTLELRYHHLTWLVIKTLEDGLFEDFFENDDVDVKKSLERIAWAESCIRTRCLAVRHLDNVNTLQELATKADCPAVRAAAGERLMQINTC